jgi:hypothetical protein
MAISNPCTWFINGHDEESFTYEGGSILYHFSPNDNGLSGTMENNVIFFANDEDHARDILRRMLEFRMQCEKKYQADEKHLSSGRSYLAEGYLKDIDNIKFTLAPINQFYVVGWACNDTIL